MRARAYVQMRAHMQYVDYKVDPYMRNEFDYKDGPSISFPLKDSIVDPNRLLFFAWILPGSIIILITAAKGIKGHMYHSLLGLFEAAALSYIITVMGKKCAGSLRPCFKAMCEWDENLQACMGSHFQIRDARQSFPSGHASASGAGLGYLSLFLHCQLQLVSVQTGLPHTILRPISLLPTLGAFLIAILRTVTYHHRFEDIAMGLFIGAACAVVAFYGQPPTFTSAPHLHQSEADTVVTRQGASHRDEPRRTDGRMDL
eukprot:Tamp_20374.p1 GENE.Tamp_20374~~Tamp_20374.p1  ORF type:complete len:258 (-),score=27.30 Tamp_20374:107-880(-)